MKQITINKKLAIIGACFMICLIILATVFMKLAKDNARCQANPLVYGAEVLAEQGLEVFCSCDPLDPKYSRFNFDKDEIYSLYEEGEYIANNFDPSIINISQNP